MNTVPSDLIQQVTLLLSGASVAKDPDVRVIYVACARRILEDQRTRFEQAEGLVRASEAEIVRIAKSLVASAKGPTR